MFLKAPALYLPYNVYKSNQFEVSKFLSRYCNTDNLFWGLAEFTKSNKGKPQAYATGEGLKVFMEKRTSKIKLNI